MTSRIGSSNSHSSGKKLQLHLPNFLALLIVMQVLYSKSFVIIAEPTVDLPSPCEACVLSAREFEKQLADDRNIKASLKYFRTSQIWKSVEMCISALLKE